MEPCVRCDRPDCPYPAARDAYNAIGEQVADSSHRITDAEAEIIRKYYQSSGNCHARAVDWRAKYKKLELAALAMLELLLEAPT